MLFSRECLIRLNSQCSAYARKQPSPKEIEGVMDVLNEFVFVSSSSSVTSSPSKNSANKAGGGLGGHPAMLELRVIQVSEG